jgi:hypothetical protein
MGFTRTVVSELSGVVFGRYDSSSDEEEKKVAPNAPLAPPPPPAPVVPPPPAPRAVNPRPAPGAAPCVMPSPLHKQDRKRKIKQATPAKKKRAKARASPATRLRPTAKQAPLPQRPQRGVLPPHAEPGVLQAGRPHAGQVRVQRYSTGVIGGEKRATSG